MAKKAKNLAEMEELPNGFYDFTWETELNQVHNPSEPAIVHEDGHYLYVWKGVSVPELVIMHPEKITPKMIDGEKNLELQRILLERFGYEAYIEAGGFDVVDEDRDSLGNPRRLLRKDVPNQAESLTMVEVLNSTPEPDGSIKKYFLKIHPEFRPLLANGNFGNPQKPTCENAVASTFGMTGKEYRKLMLET